MYSNILNYHDNYFCYDIDQHHLKQILLIYKKKLVLHSLRVKIGDSILQSTSTKLEDGV